MIFETMGTRAVNAIIEHRTDHSHLSEKQINQQLREYQWRSQSKLYKRLSYVGRKIRIVVIFAHQEDSISKADSYRKPSVATEKN